MLPGELFDDALVELAPCGVSAITRCSDALVDRLQRRRDDVDPQHHPGAAAVGLVVHLSRRAERRPVAVVEQPQLELGPEHGRGSLLADHAEACGSRVKTSICTSRVSACLNPTRNTMRPASRSTSRTQSAVGAPGPSRARGRRSRQPGATSATRPSRGRPPPPRPARRAGRRSRYPPSAGSDARGTSSAVRARRGGRAGRHAAARLLRLDHARRLAAREERRARRRSASSILARLDDERAVKPCGRPTRPTVTRSLRARRSRAGTRSRARAGAGAHDRPQRARDPPLAADHLADVVVGDVKPQHDRVVSSTLSTRTARGRPRAAREVAAGQRPAQRGSSP